MKKVKCIMGQRRIIARALAVYAYESTGSTWGFLGHKEASELVSAADEEVERWLSGGSVFPFEIDRGEA